MSPCHDCVYTSNVSPSTTKTRIWTDPKGHTAFWHRALIHTDFNLGTGYSRMDYKEKSLIIKDGKLVWPNPGVRREYGSYSYKKDPDPGAGWKLWLQCHMEPYKDYDWEPPQKWTLITMIRSATEEQLLHWRSTYPDTFSQAEAHYQFESEAREQLSFAGNLLRSIGRRPKTRIWTSTDMGPG